MSSDHIEIKFDFHHETGPIPCVVWLYRKNDGFVIDSVDASNHDGGELPESVLRQIEEKAENIAIDRDIDAAAARFDRQGPDYDCEPPMTAMQCYEANAEAKGWK